MISLAKVYALYLKAKDTKPERHAELFSAFARRVKPMPGALEDLLPHIRKDVERGAA